MAFYDEKGWWKSKTVWTGIIATVYAVLTFLGVTPPLGFDQASVTEIVMAVLGVLTVIFRVQATSIVTTPGSGAK